MLKLIVSMLIIFSFQVSSASAIGKDYMDAIILGIGPLSDSLQAERSGLSMNDLDPENIRTLQTISQQLYNDMNDNDPSFFNKLNTTMISNNPYEISLMIDELYKQTHRSIKNIYPEINELEKNLAITPTDTTALTVAVAIVAVAAIAVHNVVTVTSMVAVAVAVKVELALDTLTKSNSTTLQKEKLVRSIIINNR